MAWRQALPRIAAATTAPCASLALCEAQRKTDYDLARHQHGKTRVRVLKVRREGGVHAISEYKVETTLFSPAYDRVFTKGDNTDLVATDTQKNTVYIVAKRTDASTPEAFGVALCEHLLKEYPILSGCRADVESVEWARACVDGRNGAHPHVHGFLRSEPERQKASVSMTRGQGPKVESSIEGLVVLKTTQSGFEGYLKDKYTLLPDTQERCMATEMTASWNYAQLPQDFAAARNNVRRQILKGFFGEPATGVYSASLQESIYDAGCLVLDAVPELKQIEIDTPNLHYLPAKLLDAVGEKFEDDVVIPTSEPSGSINYATPPLTGALPPPAACDLFEVNRDTLFSAHRASELFLKRMMSLYVASHYKNTPNDLQLMADAPAHRLFVLLAPVDETANALPEILCVLQVALEGAISRGSASAALAKGDSPQGDLVPWTVATQFQDPDFPMLSGARIVRIATHPDLPRQGYGTRALQQLHAYYEGGLVDLLETDAAPSERAEARATTTRPDGGLLGETIKPRAALPPLLTPLGEKRPEKCHWIAAAFGLTQQLHKFWTRAGYRPVYLRQTASDATGEHSAVLIRALASADDDEEDERSADPEWLRAFGEDFKQRFTSLLGGPFRDMPPGLALAVLAPKVDFDDESRARGCDGSAVRRADGDALTAHDLRRLEKYAQSLVDHHLVADLVLSLIHI